MISQRKPLLTPDRVRLFLTLVPYLIERDEVSVAEAAAEFDVTPDEMRKMVEKLTVIGLPGDAGFWQQPHELFDIDWDLLDQQDMIRITQTVGLERAPRLTAREAAALLAGLQLASSMPDVAETEVFAGLLAKLARGASGMPADVIVAPPPVDEVRRIVSQALRDRVAVSFTYRAPDAPATTRTVDPVKVLITSGQWYLQGWCHLRHAMRTFHLDRVSDARLTDTPIEHAHDYVPALFEPGDSDLEAVIRFPAEIAPLLGDYLERADVITEHGVSTARLRVAEVHGLKRLAARHGGRVEVCEPGAARQATADWAAAALALYA